MTSPLFTVIVPTFNRPLALDACVAALLRLDAPEGCEILLVDDGSSPPACPPPHTLPPGFTLQVLRQANAGPGAARNHGARFARGRCLAFTDDDCRPQPGWLQALASVLHAHTEALVGGRTFNAIGERAGSCTSQLVLELVHAHFNPGQHAFFFPSNNFACTRESFLSLGGFDPDFRRASEDRDLCARWRTAGLPILHAAAAALDHHHDLPLPAFLRQHFNYGRGAWRYHRARRRLREAKYLGEVGFHRHLPLLLQGRLAPYPPALRARIILCLGLWQLANLAGFGCEAMSSVLRRP
jgi:GT2 family glycosyltransferase